MSNQAFLYRMPAGLAGAVSRIEALVSEPNLIDTTTPPTVFGIPVKLVSGKIQKCASGNTPYGFLIRPYPTQSATSEALGTATPSLLQTCDVMKSGYMQVVSAGVPAKDGQVYFLDADGTITASATSSTAIVGCKFMGAADANGLVEIAYNL
jgi:hypothetical protein